MKMAPRPQRDSRKRSAEVTRPCPNVNISSLLEEPKSKVEKQDGSRCNGTCTCSSTQSTSNGRQRRASMHPKDNHRRRDRVIGKATQVHYPDAPLKIVRGEGQYLFEEDGRKFLDLQNNVAHVGHCHPHVTKCGQEQMAELYTNSRYLHDEIVHYAERLTAKLPEKLSVVFMVCTGTEATDLAFRLARTYTKKEDALVLDRAYHGHSVTVIDLSPYKFALPGGDGQKEYIHVTPCPDTYRGMYTGNPDDADLGKKYADEAKKVIDEAHAKGREIGMFIAESLQSCGGQVIYPPGYLKAVYDHVHAAGGVCVADEVQVGFGRSGHHGFWGFEYHDVVPDIVTLGKPMGNGHPVSAVVTTQEIADAFAATKVPYFNTFGGNPVSCAIANAVLDVIEDEDLQQKAGDLGDKWLAKLKEIAPRHRLIGDVRGVGLFIGIELSKDKESKIPATEEAKLIADKLKDHGILISRDGPDNNVLKIKPPMVINEEDMEFFNTHLEQVMEEVEAHLAQEK